MDLVIKDLNESFIKIDCETGVSYELREYFSFQVPGYRFNPLYKAKRWDGFIRLFSISKGKIYKGLLQEVKNFCNQRGYTYQYLSEEKQEDFTWEEAVDFISTLNLPLEPRDYQIDAFLKAIQRKRMIVLSATGSGKSLILYMIIRYLQAHFPEKPGIVIVPTTSLVKQMKNDFISYGMDGENIHEIYSGKEKVSDCPCWISTWQSVFRLPKEFFNQFQLIIADEVHLWKAKSTSGIMEKAEDVVYRIGTTGTLSESKTNAMVLTGLFGQVEKVTSSRELMDLKQLAELSIKCLLLKHDKAGCKEAKSYSYQEEMDYLVLKESRNKLIGKLAISLKGNSLVLFQYVKKHGEVLFELLQKLDPNRKIFYVHGGTDVEEREAIRHIVEKEKDAIIVASVGVFQAGINIRNLHNIVFASPSKSRIRILQSIGRALRTSETKMEATLYDIADDLRIRTKENYTLKHFKARIRLYSEEQFNFKIYQIDLKGS